MADAAKARAWNLNPYSPDHAVGQTICNTACLLQHIRISPTTGTNPGHPVLCPVKCKMMSYVFANFLPRVGFATAQHSHGAGAISHAIKSPRSNVTRARVAGAKARHKEICMSLSYCKDVEFLFRGPLTTLGQSDQIRNR